MGPQGMEGRVVEWLAEMAGANQEKAEREYQQ